MKKLEFVQTAINGGFPAPNGNGFDHGEPVYVANKRDVDNALKDADDLKRACNRVAELEQEAEEWQKQALVMEQAWNKVRGENTELKNRIEKLEDDIEQAWDAFHGALNQD